LLFFWGAATPPGGKTPAPGAKGLGGAFYTPGLGCPLAWPALVFYRHFRNLVDTYVVDMELQAVKLVDVVHGARK
jgi:biopolymer transport protein ExbB